MGKYFSDVVEQAIAAADEKRKARKDAGEEVGDLTSEEVIEEAAALRDRIDAIKVLGKRQKIIAGVCSDFDVWGLYLEAKCCYAVLHYEEGKLTSKEAELFSTYDLETEGEILSALLLQYYGDRRALPKEICIPAPIEDQEVLEQLLAEIRDLLKSKQ